MELFYATTNEGKLRSLRKRLHPYGIKVIHADCNITELQSNDLKEVAAHKVQAAFKQLGKPVVALDAAFEISALKGFPGAYAKYISETIGVPGILKLMQGVQDRNAAFVHCLAYMDGKLAEPHTFIDSLEGTVTEEQKGQVQAHLWSEFSRIFIPRNYEKTLAEMTEDEYDAWKRKESHYGSQFGEWFTENRRPHE